LDGVTKLLNLETAILVDANQQRALQIQETLLGDGVYCVPVGSVEELSKIKSKPDVLFVAADEPPFHLSEAMLASLTDIGPTAPIVLLNNAETWQLTTAAIRERMWVDIPKSNQYHDLLERYTSAKASLPAIIIDSDPSLYDKLNAQWKKKGQGPALCWAEKVGVALELSAKGQTPVFLNLRSELSTSTRISTLIYKLCPVVAAVLIKMHTSTRPFQNFYFSDPASRFVVMGPPYNRNSLDSLFTQLNGNWSASNSLSKTPTSNRPEASFR
jgi:hypothetical protein